MFGALVSRHYSNEIRSQILALIRSIRVTKLGVGSALMERLMGKEVKSAEFPKVKRRKADIFLFHSRGLASCKSLEAFAKQARWLVFDWRVNHSGLFSSKCLALGIVNKSKNSDWQIERRYFARRCIQGAS